MRRAVVVAIVGALVVVPAVPAHVTLNPPEWEEGGFARFAVRVPNERDDGDTIEISVQFPENVISASFQPAPGWERTVTMAKLETPIEQEGEDPITERIDTVTWSGGKIAPGEFEEFGVSFRVPEEPGAKLAFPSVQTYSGGEVVRWIGPEDSDTPAPIVEVIAAAGGDQAAAPAEREASDDDASAVAFAALGVGIGAFMLGLAALALAWRRTRPSI